ncbi:MAG: M20 family metallopeptidase [Firmicutes bacterium]|nr:M20 family metallopeptidase [Bacillota bacterium]
MEDLKELLLKHIDQDELVKLTMDMVRMESHYKIQKQEKEVAEYIKAYFDKNDIPAYITEVEKDRHYNVVATLDSGKPGRTLMLNGHMDTVLASGMENAFEPKIIDGEIWGRGTSDMKGPLAAGMAAMKALKETGALKAGKLLFTGVADEEWNSWGAIDLMESGVVGSADAAIVCEPTCLTVRNANRGLEWFRFTFKGKAVHGGEMHKGVNAILKAVKFIDGIQEKLIPEAERNGGILNIGVINGGTKPSTVPGECVLYVDKRYTTKETYESLSKEFLDLCDEIRKDDPDFVCEVEPMGKAEMKEGYVHGPSYTDPSHPIVQITKKYVDEVTGVDAPVEAFPAWADAGLYSTYLDTPVIIMGPGFIECCHALDERIPVYHLPKAALIYALTAIDFCESK